MYGFIEKYRYFNKVKSVGSMDFTDLLLLEAFTGLKTAKSLHYLLAIESLENRLKTTPSETEERDESNLFSCFDTDWCAVNALFSFLS